MQAFNPAPPPLPASLYASTIDGEANQPPAKDEEQDKLASNFAAYKPTRRAVLHTLDISQDYQTHARKIVRGFRQGLYAHNVDFHVGTIPTYLESRLEAQPQTTSSSGKLEPEPFLQHTILDLPDCHKMLSIVSQCLKPNGLVLVFCPSITQVVACVREVKALGLPLLLEDTREIGELAGVGGKSWDVRIMRARSFERKEAAAEVKSAEELLGFELGPLAKDGDAEVVEIEREKREEITEENGYNAIARPKSPGRFMAAAFVGVFRRLEW